MPSLVLIAAGPRLADVIGRRLNTRIERRRKNAVDIVSILVGLHVAWVWILSSWIIEWFGLSHGLAIQVGATIGALGMGVMGWIFICCAIDEFIKEPNPPRDTERKTGG